jgi:hypothetical protein
VGFNPVLISEEEFISCPLCHEVVIGEVKYYAEGDDTMMVRIGNKINLEEHICGYVQSKDERN